MKILSIIYFTILCSSSVLCQKENNRKLVIITFDGYRWQDVFRGADSALLFETATRRKDSAELIDNFWSADRKDRREKLMPFFWNTFPKKGQVYGNRDLESYVNVTNPYWFSYPGYNEIFTGHADTNINSNDYPANPNITLQEYLNKQPGYHNSVAIFTSWEAFTRILNEPRSKLMINAGYTPMKGNNLNETEKILSEEQFLIPKPMGPHERPDAITYFLAKEYLKQNHPKVLQISFIETDAFGHQDKYDQYLKSAHSCDAMLKDLWNYIQSDPFYKDQTTIFIATDHGRGNDMAWTHHNSSTPGSDQIWFAVMGPYTLPLGEMKNQQVYQNQYAETMAALLQIDLNFPHKTGSIIQKVIQKNKMKKVTKLIFLFLVTVSTCTLKGQQQNNGGNDGAKERRFLVKTLTQIANPVLDALSKNELRLKMPVEGKEAAKREYCSHLEAFGRLLDGMAPWLELGPDNTPEGKLREKYIELSVKCIRNATDPKSPDFLTFNKGNQPLVDAAFFAEALLRAPTQLWDRLDSQVKVNVINALKSSRVIVPSFTNHLLFSAVVEAALLRFTGSADNFRMDYAVKLNMDWYKGDGIYGDGPIFHWDYYNSYVIQPMLLQILQVLKDANYTSRLVKKETYDLVLKRAQRYAAIQERLISPEGTYPAIGRSLAYRFGAFHLLSKIAYMHDLPEGLKPQQVRAAIYTVIKKQIEVPGTFDKNGWLRVGFYSYQPSIGENYISTGSLYLCSEAFIILGLPPNDTLWLGKDLLWTQQKIWSGEDVPNEHALQDN